MTTGTADTKNDAAATTWAAFDRACRARELLEDIAEALADVGDPDAARVLAASRELGRRSGRMIVELAG